MKEGAVVVACIHKAGPCGHVYGVGARSIVGAAFGGAGQMESGAALPSGHDGFAGFVLINLWRVGGLHDLRQGEAVALLDVEDGVMTENEGGALVFVGLCVVLRGVGKLLEKDDGRSAFAFADVAF
jgi:hypothetical protein